MNRHEWEQIESPATISMKCKHCGELINIDNTEHWNLEIFADCPEK